MQPIADTKEFRGKADNEQRSNQKHVGNIDGTKDIDSKNVGQQQEIFKEEE